MMQLKKKFEIKGKKNPRFIIVDINSGQPSTFLVLVNFLAGRYL
jgi:hypothetical protein